MAFSASLSSLLPGFRARALKLLSSPQALAAVVQAASRAAQRGSVADAFAALRTDLAASVALVQAWASGEYRQVATSSVVTLVAAILYFLAPVDAIPDLLPLGGYVDDAALLALVATQLDGELRAFQAWQSERNHVTAQPAALAGTVRRAS